MVKALFLIAISIAIPMPIAASSPTQSPPKCIVPLNDGEMKNDIFGHYLSYGIPMSLHGPIKGVDFLPDGKHIFMMEEMPFTVAVDVIKNQVSLQDEHWAFFREADNSLSYVHFWTKISGDCRRAQLRKEP